MEVFFADPANAADCQTHQTVDNDHGRIETRRNQVCHKLEWLRSERRHPDERDFPHLAAIAMVEAVTEQAGKTSRERRYYLCSAKLDAKAFAYAARAHWGVENRSVWRAECSLKDADLSSEGNPIAPSGLRQWAYRRAAVSRQIATSGGYRSRPQIWLSDANC